MSLQSINICNVTRSLQFIFQNIYAYAYIYTHSVRINEIRGHVHFRSAGSGTKGVLETGNIKKGAIE